MTEDNIFQKYWTTLKDVAGDVTKVSDACVALALRLAIKDAYIAAQTRPAPQPADQADRRTIEHAFQQLAQLNEWLEQHRTDLYFDGNYDTAQAVLVALKEMEAESNNTRDERDAAENANRRLNEWLTVNVGEHNTLGDTELVIHTITTLRTDLAKLRQERRRADAATFNGNGASAQEQDADSKLIVDIQARRAASDTAPQAADWRSVLDAEFQEIVESLDTGRRTFRQIPKRERLIILQAILRSIPESSMNAYDVAKPTWAPQASSIPVTFGCSWLDLRTLDPLDVAI